MRPYLLQIICNVVGGALVAVLTWLFLRLRKKFCKWKFQRVFGEDSIENFFVIYGNLKHRDCFEKDGSPMDWQYMKPGLEGALFKAFSVTSLAEARSAKYLSEMFGKVVKASPVLVCDEEKKDKLDISFCSFGGHNNFKTGDILRSSENIFFDLDSDKIGVKGKQGSKFRMHNNYDYGFVMKVIPKNFPNRVWIATAGLGEWGTSGAAWYLSKNWKKMPKNKAFGLIIKTKIEQDESAEEVYRKE